MLRVKMMPNNQVALIDDTKVLVFNAANDCIEETTITPKYTTGMQSLPVISVLMANNDVDVALFHDDIVEHVKNPHEGSRCAQDLFMNRQYIRMVKKDGKVDKIRYSQMIFIYPSTFDVKSCLSIIRG